MSREVGPPSSAILRSENTHRPGQSGKPHTTEASPGLSLVFYWQGGGGGGGGGEGEGGGGPRVQQTDAEQLCCKFIQGVSIKSTPLHRARF